jgi:hypothetical protein
MKSFTGEDYITVNENLVLKVKYTYYPAEIGHKDYLGFQEEPNDPEYICIEELDLVKGTLEKLVEWLNDKVEIHNYKNLYDVLSEEILKQKI